MKPDTTEAMQTLIKQIREAIPFDTPIALMCNGPCTGCAKKLLDYLDMELLDKERTYRMVKCLTLVRSTNWQKQPKKYISLFRKMALSVNKKGGGTPYHHRSNPVLLLANL
ncbi:hypothetical protein [Neptuniibacter pectenicola]|jgi:hypothetical protein|uniref:hypothetical protein n=1 Tax=Neptuniibacter pectenicola TaxID=1806669 RepID=UPI000ABE7715|nr:hypothetical protein [Neptuniibacter pectenicola]